MSSILTRRSMLRGLLAAPAVVAAASLMPIRGLVVPRQIVFVDSDLHWTNNPYWIVHPNPWSMPRDGDVFYTDELADVLSQQVEPLTGQIGEYRGFKFIEARV